MEKNNENRSLCANTIYQVRDASHIIVAFIRQLRVSDYVWSTWCIEYDPKKRIGIHLLFFP